MRLVGIPRPRHSVWRKTMINIRKENIYNHKTSETINQMRERTPTLKMTSDIY